MTDEEFMAQAIKEAQKALKRGEVPIGAVIILDGKIIAKGFNRREKTKDCTAHAEIVALKKACKKIRNWRLNDCTIYVTKEPCLMCYGAILNARVNRLVYGFGDDKLPEAVREQIVEEKPILNHKLKVTSGVLESDCKNIFNLLFKR